MDGQRLSETLFADPELRSAWDRAIGQARAHAPRCRIRLRIDADASELHALPWESLADKSVILSTQADTPFSHYFHIESPWGEAIAERPIRVLIALSNPDDLGQSYGLTPLDVEAEHQVLDAVFAPLDPEQVRVTYLEAPVTLERLEAALREGCHILHFVGHGAFDRTKRHAALYLQDDEGHTAVVRDDQLSGMLQRQGVRPQLVALMACQSAARSTVDALAGLGPRLVSAGVPAVVAMQDLVSVAAARAFAATFYARLLRHGLVDGAANEARGTLLTAGRAEAATPVLYVRLRSGPLLTGVSPYGPEARALPDVEPYRGLEPFEAEHAAFYFGREAMVESLVERVEAQPFVFVVGPSGCGKSSLVRAGLVTALGEGWAIRIMRPGADPLRALAAELAALLEPEADRVARTVQVGTLVEHLETGVQPIADIAASLREVQPDLSRVLLLADQFEELYTECQEEAMRARFVESLLALSEQGIKVALTLRADYYGHVLDDGRLGLKVDDGLVNVLPMVEAELRAAIERPALAAGRTLEPGLVERILEDVAGQPGDLPLLEFALTGLWEGQTAGGTLTHEGYEAIGRVEGAIAQQAETIFEELANKGQGEAVKRIFTRLTHYGEGEGTRRQARLEELVTARTPREQVAFIVRALADARLLVTDREGTTDETAAAEVAHEALIRGWKRLRRWLDEDRAFGLWREKLEITRGMWEEAKRGPGALLRGAPLGEAEGWLDGRGDDLNQAEHAFIQESIAARERAAAEREEQRRRELKIAQDLAEEQTRSARRLGRLAVVLAAVFLLAVGAAIFAGIKQRDASRQGRISLAQSLAALAPDTDNDDELTVLLAVEALHVIGESSGSADWLIDRSLRDVLSDPFFSNTLSGHEASVLSVAYSPEGRWLASGSAEPDGSSGTVRLWDMQNLEAEPRVLRGHEASVWSVAYSPEGRWLASGSADTTVRLWLVRLEDLAELGCRKVRRNMTREEWNRYLPGQEYRKTCE